MNRLAVRLAALLAVAALAACAARPGAESGSRDERFYSFEQAGGAGRRLIPTTTLDGHMARSAGAAASVLQVLTGSNPATALVRMPTAVAASEHGVFILDETTHALYRFRWTAEGRADGTPGGEFKQLRTLTDLEEPTDLHVSNDGDVFVSDGAGRKVVQYNKDADQIRVFTDTDNLNRPVAVTTDKRGLRVFVADGLFDRVVAFNRAGISLYGIGARGDEEGGLRNVRDMVQGPDGLLYVVDGIHRRISVFGLDGSYLSTFGQDTFTDPGGIAVDEEGRVYLADGFNHQIVIFSGGRVVEVYGKPGAGPGEFHSPGSLAYHQGRLYVVDRRNARIQVFRVVPEKDARERRSAGAAP
ncbi:MAG TPA: NHL repeat-containing protein [Azospirillum sp.]|nr:NHL repeat-containing protein [Azospirillum sp.]